jgi:hypothetical protein
MTTIGIATIPEREQSLRVTLDSLHGQADRVYVYLNGYPAKPAWMEATGAQAMTGPDVGDIGKFMPAILGVAGAVHVTCDDDLIYPPYYVARLLAGIEIHGGAVSFHGRVMQSPQPSYYRGKHTPLPCLGRVTEDRSCSVIGTGCMAYRPLELPLTMLDFPAPNMADIWFSRAANTAGMARTVLAHDEGWIMHGEIDHNRTIFAAYVNRDAMQTKAFNETVWNW